MNQLQASLHRRSRIRSIVFNAGWLGIERIVRAATSFMVVVWIARTLGPELFGTLNFAQSIVVGLVPLVTMGLNPVLVRDLVQHPDKRDSLLASAVLLRLGVGCCSNALLSFGGQRFPSHVVSGDYRTGRFCVYGRWYR